MAATTVPIRLSSLLCPKLTAATKMVAIGLQMNTDLERRVLFSPTRIQRLVGISRPTVRISFKRLREPGHPEVPDDLVSLTRMKVSVDRELITDRKIPAMARVVYCIIRGLHRLKRYDILSSYTAIAKILHKQARTIRRAIDQLVEAGWLSIGQKNQLGHLRYKFPNPKATQQGAYVRRAEQRLEKSEYHGEALALLWCDTLVDSTDYEDDCYPAFLTNPETNQRLQADRYYVNHKVVIEFQGLQHDGSTPMFPERVSQAQRARDRIKRQICKRRRVPFIEVRAEDLTFERMRELLGGVLPLHDVSAGDPIIRYLEKRSRLYRGAIQKIGQSERKAEAPPGKP